VVVVVVNALMDILPVAKLQMFTEGVGVGVWVGVGEFVGVGVGVSGTSQSKKAVKSKTSQGLVVEVVVSQKPCVNVTSHKSGHDDVDGVGPPNKQLPPIVSLKHHCNVVEL
jgi:riboflavin synthase